MMLFYNMGFTFVANGSTGYDNIVLIRVITAENMLKGLTSMS